MCHYAALNSLHNGHLTRVHSPRLKEAQSPSVFQQVWKHKCAWNIMQHYANVFPACCALTGSIKMAWTWTGTFRMHSWVIVNRWEKRRWRLWWSGWRQSSSSSLLTSMEEQWWPATRMTTATEVNNTQDTFWESPVISYDNTAPLSAWFRLISW